MLIYNIKTQVEFDLGYNPLIMTELWAFYKNIAHLAGGPMGGPMDTFLVYVIGI